MMIDAAHLDAYDQWRFEPEGSETYDGTPLHMTDADLAARIAPSAPPAWETRAARALGDAFRRTRRPRTEIVHDRIDGRRRDINAVTGTHQGETFVFSFHARTFPMPALAWGKRSFAVTVGDGHTIHGSVDGLIGDDTGLVVVCASRAPACSDLSDSWVWRAAAHALGLYEVRHEVYQLHHTGGGRYVVRNALAFSQYHHPSVADQLAEQANAYADAVTHVHHHQKGKAP